MSLTPIDINGTTYTAYASVAKADAALAVDPARMAAWAALGGDAKAIRLIAATHRLDLLNWRGQKAGGAAQANAWPRSGLVYRDGTPVPPDAIPREIERATILLAGSIAATPAAADAGKSGFGLKRAKAGSAEVEFFFDRQAITGRPIQDETVYALISLWLEGGTGSGVSASTGPVATGTDGKSAFEDADRYGRTEGFK